MKKQIEDHPDYYVTTEGDVISMKYGKERKLKAYPNHGGYLSVDLLTDRKRNPRFVARLIAQAFIPNPRNLPEVDHISGVKTDNRVQNLRWASVLENRQAYQKKPKGCSSIFRGVNWHMGTGKFVARIQVNGKRHALGYYDREKDAAMAFDRAAVRHGFPQQSLNFSKQAI